MPEIIYSGIFAKPFGIYYDKTMTEAMKSKEIIAISKETAEELSEYYNINIIRDAIRADLFTEKGQKQELYLIGTISKLNKRKRIDLLIESYLEANIPNSQLLIGGTGNRMDYLKKVANGDSRVKFLGFISDEDLNKFYNSLDVFVFPTMMEGYGLLIVEAMVCSLPVITLEDALIPNDLKEKTFVSSKENFTNDLKEKDFSVNIKTKLGFVKEHSKEKIGKQHLEVYKKVLEY